MDDENCMVWNWDYSFGEAPLSEDDRKDDSAGPENVCEDQNFRKKRNKDNNWLIDHEVQRTKTYTGIQGVNTQDHAVQESAIERLIPKGADWRAEVLPEMYQTVFTKAGVPSRSKTLS